MKNNNLYKVENTLRSMAKRYKSVKYSLGLAILFLMMGVSAFSEEVAIQENAVPTREEIATSRENLKNSVGSLQSKIDQARAENEKELAGLKLELIQLMEQGDQVVKSPWSSWQFGANYFYSKWNGTYKGRGDKAEKYPFEGVFTRSTNVFGRTTSARTAEQRAVLSSIIAANGGFDPNGNGLNYGLISRAQVTEDPMTIEVSAGIRPRNIQKGAITLNVPPVNIAPPSPSAAPGVPSTPSAPNINIPSFAPVAPEVNPPTLPTPPTFAVVLGADCNSNCSSSTGTPRQNTSGSFLASSNNTSSQNISTILHYTWPYGQLAEQSYAFKMYREENTTTLPAAPANSNNTYYFNSYNFGNEFPNAVVDSMGIDRNHQYFFIGGSRFWEIDNATGTPTFEIPSGRTVNLGGILTLGFVSQENGATLLNSGTITDVAEKDDAYIRNMTYDSGQNYKLIYGPNGAQYQVKRSTDGYVGYKVGIAQVEENSRSGWGSASSYQVRNQQLQNAGTIDFRGERSIGMYIYLPKQSTGGYDHMVTYAKMINLQGANISLSGAESYGMKLAAHSDSSAEMRNEGTITLRRNPTAQGGNDRADNSAAMALMADSSVRNKVSLDAGKALNNGTINLQDNISNALGMFVNIDSNMTNNKTINISARAQKDTNNQYKLNVGMRADQVDAAGSTAANYDTTVINAANANINITGQGAIGMVANGVNTTGATGKGTATATNRGTITLDKGTETAVANQGKDSYGMLATNKASIVNDTTGKINIGTSPNSVGMTSMLDGTNVSKSENKGEINITGANSTGVYNTGEFLMNTATAKINVAGRQSIGLYAKGMDSNTKTELKAGTVTASNSGVGLYSDKSVVNLDNTSNNLNLIANNGGLLFYNYESNNAANVANGIFNLTGNVKATVNNGGYAFYLKGATIANNGSVGGLANFFNSMFNDGTSTGNLDITLNAGGTLMVLDKPQGGSIRLSNVRDASSIASSLGNRVGINNASTKYKVYAVYRGGLQIDQNVNLNNDSTSANPDPYYRVDFRSSSMTLDAGKSVTGSKAGQLALFQGNYDEGGTTKGTVGEISVINNGTIRLSGNSTTTSTTTAMAGDFITLTNNGTVEVSGTNGVGIYGAGGSKITNAKNGTINIGEKGVALFGANQLGSSTLGDKSISITNAGTIRGISGKTNAFGIFAENTQAINKSVLTNSGTIDFTSSQGSIGVHTVNSTFTNTGNINMGVKGVAVDAKNSNITSAGNISLAGQGIAFNLSGAFTGRTLNLTSKVTLNGDGNSIFNLKDMTFNSSGSGLTENLNIVSNGKSFSYFSLDNSVLTYDKNKTFSGNNMTLVSAKNSTVNWNANATLNGQNNVAFYLNGTKAGAAPELTITAGKAITLTGNKSVGAYGINGARIVNNANITVGENGAALYSTGAGTLRNTGILTLGKNSVGMYMKDGTSLTHTGQINSTQEGAKGIVVNRATATTYVNNGRINLTGTGSIGIHAEGAAHTIQNLNSVTVGNTTGTAQSVAIHLKDGGSFRSLTGTTVKAGTGSIGIYGTTVAATIENNAKVEVGDGGTGIYAKNGNVDLQSGSRMSIGKTLGTNKEAVGVYYVGNGGTINNNLSSFTIGQGSIGIVDAGTGTSTINNNLQSVALPGDAVYTYTSNRNSNVVGNTKITSSGNGNYGYYVAGNLTNNAGANMDFSSGTGNVGIYSAYTAGGTGVARNAANITVGKTDLENELYSIGMAAGYTSSSKTNTSQNRVGHVINTGTITVASDNSIGMYASGRGSTAENDGTINIVSGNKAIGMYLENGATGINTVNGKITIEAAAKNAIAAYATGANTTFKNYGTITIKAPGSKGVVTANDAQKNLDIGSGTINVQNPSAEGTKNIEGTAGGDKVFGDKTISVPRGGRTPTVITDANGNVLTATDIDVTSGTNLTVTNPTTKAPLVSKEHQDQGSISRIGMYVDTSGVNFTNPIQGLQHLTGLQRADLIIGAEAAEYTNAKTITVGQNILRRYNNAIDSSGLEKFDVISGSLTWAAATNRLDGSGRIQSVIMVKTDYKEYAKNSDVPYNFLDGLEQRYDMNALDSREKRLFNKINGIGKNEAILLSQAFDEMLGQQYANVQQRIQATGGILDKEFDYLRDEWRTASKDSNKIKTFGTRGEYKTDTAGIKDYKYHAYGVAYVHENEDIKLGRGIGWYTGIVHNTFKFKDIGNSKEEMLQGKIGMYKSVPFDENNSLNWTISGDIFVGHNKMKRKYLVVDEIFNAKSKYYTYGIGIKNEIGKDFRLSESFSIRPYAALKLEYGRMTKIKEKSGEVRLEVKQNDYFSVRPEIGAELAFKHYFGMKALRTSVGVAYENELGRVANAKNKARVAYTSAGWYDLRGEKEDRRGNVKFDFNVGVDNTRVGVTANVGYDTKGENLRGGVGLRVIF